jgi:hypothetical protein
MEYMKNWAAPISKAKLKTLTMGKRAFCVTGLFALGQAFELTSQLVPELNKPIECFENGYRVSMGVLPSGPSITLEKREGQVAFIGMGSHDPDLSLQFVNLDSAILVFSGMCGSHTAAAEQRISVFGNNVDAVRFTQAMSYVQIYLFPGILFPILFREPPKLNRKQLIIKAKILGLLGPKVLRSLVGRASN